MTFCDVLYVPEATGNVLTVRQLEEQGVEAYVGKGRQQLQYEGTTIPVERSLEREYKIMTIVGTEARDREKQQQAANNTFCLSGGDHAPAEPVMQHYERATPARAALWGEVPADGRCSATARTPRTRMQRADYRAATRRNVSW